MISTQSKRRFDAICARALKFVSNVRRTALPPDSITNPTDRDATLEIWIEGFEAMITADNSLIDRTSDSLMPDSFFKAYKRQIFVFQKVILAYGRSLEQQLTSMGLLDYESILVRRFLASLRILDRIVNCRKESLFKVD